VAELRLLRQWKEEKEMLKSLSWRGERIHQRKFGLEKEMRLILIAPPTKSGEE